MAINLMAPVSDAGMVSRAERVLKKLRRESTKESRSPGTERLSSLNAGVDEAAIGRIRNGNVTDHDDPTQ